MELSLGLLGVFLSVFISHAIPFIPAPGYLATVTYVANASDPLSIALATAATALGAALGKLVVFLYGYGARRVISGEEMRYAKQFFERLSKWGIDIAVFIFAASPLADDVLYIPLGASGYNIKRFFLAVLAGKTVLATAIVLFADIVSTLVKEATGSIWTGTAVIAAITLALTVMALRIKWSKALEAYETGGVTAAIKAALASIIGRN